MQAYAQKNSRRKLVKRRPAVFSLAFLLVHALNYHCGCTSTTIADTGYADGAVMFGKNTMQSGNYS